MSTTTASTLPARRTSAAPTRPTPPSFARLTAVELRKSADTRGGHWLFAGLGLLVAAALGYRALTGDGPVAFEGLFGSPMFAVQLLLPVIGVLLMTSAWTQRTVLTTFTATPRRGRVLAAKVAAALVVAVSASLVVAAAAAAVTLLAAAVSGDPASWSGAATAVVGTSAASALSMLMGVGIGALVQSTGPAVAAYFVAPTFVTVAAGVLLDSDALWVSVFPALTAVGELDLGGVAAPSATALALWIALPLALGAVRTVRREIG